MVRTFILFAVLFNFCFPEVELSIDRDKSVIDFDNTKDLQVLPQDVLNITHDNYHLTFYKKIDGPGTFDKSHKTFTQKISHVRKNQLWFGVLSKKPLNGTALEILEHECEKRYKTFQPYKNPYEKAQKRLVHIVINKVRVAKSNDQKKSYRQRVTFIKVFEAKLYMLISKVYTKIKLQDGFLSAQLCNYQENSFVYVFCFKDKKLKILFPKDNSDKPSPYKDPITLPDIDIKNSVCYLLVFNKKQAINVYKTYKYLSTLKAKELESLFRDEELISQRNGTEVMFIKNKKQILLELEDLIAFKIKKHKLAGR